MTQSLRKLAETAGVAHRTISNVKERLGIVGETISDEDAERILEEVSSTTGVLKKTTLEKTSKKSTGFVPNVRRIDKNDDSSVSAMLQDCKERYVRNEGLIQRLQYEIDSQDILMHGNGNGTLSPLPQLGIMEKFQKVNISLRNQIMALEEEVGLRAEPRKEDNPFE